MPRRRASPIAFVVLLVAVGCGDPSPRESGLPETPSPEAQAGKPPRVHAQAVSADSTVESPSALLERVFPDEESVNDPYRDPAVVTAEFGADAADQLAALLGSDGLDEDARALCVAALRLLGRDAASAVPALVALLGTKGDDEILELLSCLGPAGAEALGDRAADEAYEFQGEAQSALEDMAPGDVAAVVLRLLGSASADVRSAGVEIVAGHGESAALHVPALVDLLADPDVGAHALSALQRLGPAAGAAVPALLRLLDSTVASETDTPTRTMERWDLIRAVGAVGRENVTAVRVLGRLAASDDDAASIAADALKSMGADARPAAAEVAAAIGGHTSIAVPLMDALLNIGPADGAAAAVPALRKWLDHDGVEVRISALRAISGLGPVAEELLPRVREFLDDEEPRARLLASLAIYRVAGDLDPARVNIGKYLRHDHWHARSWAAEIPGMMGPGGVALVPEIRAFLGDPDSNLDYALGPLVRSLGKLGPPASAALAELRALLADPEHRAFTDDLIVAITSIGVPDDEAVALWSRLLRDRSSDDRLRAVRALSAMGDAARPARSLLEPMVRDPDWRVRAAVRAHLDR